MPQPWPDELPQQFDKDGYSDAFADTRFPSQTDLGPALVRSRYTSMPRKVSGNMKMTKKQLIRLHDFWNKDTLHGKLPFLFPDPVFGYGTRKNWVPNSGYDGAVAGTPGTAPNGWSGFGTQNGIGVYVGGLGMEGDLEYVDIHFAGTPTGTGIAEVSFAEGIPSAASQVWTESLNARMVAGSKVNLQSLSLAIYSLPGLPGSAGFFKDILTSLTSSELQYQRFSNTATPTGNVTSVAPRLRLVGALDIFIDITVRVAGIQMEKTDRPTDFMATPNQANPIARFAPAGRPPSPVFLGGVTWGVQLEMEIYEG